MNRLIAAFLVLCIVFMSGCGTVRGTYSAYVTKNCLPKQSTTHHKDYSPSPVFDSQQEDSLPVLDLEEDIPPPPPETLDATRFDAKPLRKPVLPPMKNVTVRWSKNVMEKMKI